MAEHKDYRKKNIDSPDSILRLRQQAEKIVSHRESLHLETEQYRTPEEVKQLLHDLSVHQVELEMQNEELRNAHFELAQSQERYFDLYDLAPVGYITINKKGVIKEANLTAAQLIGMTKGELVNKPVTRFIHKEDQEIYYLNHKKFQGSFPLSIQEIRLITKNGDSIWIRMDVTADATSDSPQLCKVTLSDITLQKQMEQELQKAHKLESLGFLAGGIAHDFNNLLSGIFGFLELALVHNKNEKIGSYLKKALSPMDRAKALTLQLLTFSKGGGPNKKLQSLFPFVRESIDFILSGSNVSCKFYVPEDLWICSYDHNQFGQVIDNVIINAQQAMPNGGNIVVAASNTIIHDKDHSLLLSGKYIKLSITDHGAGIPNDILPKIFDPFFTTKSSGHGLGLATCYSIISRHNGTIEVDSKPDCGTTFHIYLPALLNTTSRPIDQPF